MEGPKAPRDPEKNETLFLYFKGQRNFWIKTGRWNRNPVRV